MSWGGNGGDSSGVAAQLFAALDRNVRLTTWGTAHFGGDIRDIADVLSAGVVDIVSRDHAFANLKKTVGLLAGVMNMGVMPGWFKIQSRMVLSGFIPLIRHFPPSMRMELSFFCDNAIVDSSLIQHVLVNPLNILTSESCVMTRSLAIRFWIFF